MLLSSWLSGSPVTPGTAIFDVGLAFIRGTGQPDEAAAFVAQGVAIFWQALCPDKEVRRPFRATRFALSAPAADLAAQVGRAAALLPIETACDLLGRLHTAALPAALRRQQGAFYTPPALAEFIAQRETEAGTDWHRARVLDPACGAGATLLPALRRLLAAQPDLASDVVLDEVAARLHGMDLDPGAAWIAQILIDAFLLPWSLRAGRAAPQIVTVADSLHTGLAPGWDLVLGNPPYGAVTLSAADRARFQRSLKGRANLYGLFIDRAVDLLRPGGLIAFLTPTTCLSGDYSNALRCLLKRAAPPVSLDFLVSRKGVYDGAQQETMLGVWQRGALSGPIELAEIRLEDTGLEVHPIGAATLPADAGAPWPLPRRMEQAHLAAALAHASHHLSDWGYRVRTGPTEAHRVKDRLAASPGNSCVPLLWAEAVGTGQAGFTWPGARRAGMAWFDATGYEAMLVREPALLVQRTTAPEQARRLITGHLTNEFLAAHGGAVAVENHLNLIEPANTTPAVPLNVVATFFASAAADAAFRCLSSSLAVSATELRALPLPHADRMVTLARLLQKGAGPHEIENECERLYLQPGRLQ